jgi:prepilin-type N-terminal cleavage/methylation domain-containing protein
MNRAAFSLIEVLIACTILAVGMCAAIVLFPAAMRNYRLARGLSEMGMFAKNKLNEVKAMRQYSDGRGTQGFISWTLSFDNTTVTANATNATVALRRMTLTTAYDCAGTALNETFVTYLDE